MALRPKGITLLNYCGVKHDLVDFVVDANCTNKNKFLLPVIFPSWIW